MKDFIENFIKQSKGILESVDKVKLQEGIKLIDETRKKQKHIFLIGNGGSASNASHFAADLSKWATGDGTIPTKTICLLENIPAISALTNDHGWENVYTEQLKNLCDEGDLIVAFSVHGGKGSEKAGVWSQNITKAIDFVHKKKGKSIGFTGFDGGAMAKLCTVNINVPAESTPHVEGLHAVLGHMIAEALRMIAVKDKIKNMRK